LICRFRLGEYNLQQRSETDQFRRADALIGHRLGPLFEGPDGVINLLGGYLGLLPD
jgi:hypothetical protein